MLFFTLLFISNSVENNFIRIKFLYLPFPYDKQYDPIPSEAQLKTADYLFGLDRFATDTRFQPLGYVATPEITLRSEGPMTMKLYLIHSPSSNSGCNNDPSSTSKTYIKTLKSTTDYSFYYTIGIGDIPRKCKQCEEGKRHCASCNNDKTECTKCDDPEIYDVEPVDKLYCVRNCEYVTEEYREYYSCLDCSTSNNDEILCGKCDIGYYLKDNKCLKCSYNCWTCTDSSTCTDCWRGYYLYENYCHPCPEDLNCDTCSFKEGSTTELKCDRCDVKSYQLDGKCIRCPENCYGCKKEQENIVCTSCYAGNYLENNVCKKCNEEKHCQNCKTSPDVCDYCISGYYENENGLCISCNMNGCSSCSLESNQLKCLSCIDTYYLDGNGKCVKCPSNLGCFNCRKDKHDAEKLLCRGCADGYYDDTPDTCTPCPSNCLNCYPVGENIKCTKCINNKYEIKDDKCVLKECKPEGMDHCSACAYSEDGSTKQCTTCDAKNYEVSEDKSKCIPKKCNPEGMDHCSTCAYKEDGTTKECTACDSNDYIISQDKSKCEISACDPKSIKNCVECKYEGQNKVCQKCDDGYELSSDKSSCVEKAACIQGENHCQECNSDKTECTKCEKDNMEIDGISCNCKKGYVYTDGKCVLKIVPISPQPTPKPEKLPDGSSALSEDQKTQTISTEKLTNPDSSKVYTISLSNSADLVNIKNENNANLYISIPRYRRALTIVPEDDRTNVTLDVGISTIQLKNAANTTINANTNSLTINGVTGDTNDEITIGKVVPYYYGLDLSSDKKLVIKELQVYDDRIVSTKEKNVKIEKVKIEQQGKFEPSKELQLQNIEIGIDARIQINEALQDSNIIVYYNKYQMNDQKIPLFLNGKLSTVLPKSLTIRNKELGELLEEDDFILIESDYPKDMHDDAYNYCNSWRKVYDKSDSPFKSVKCQYYENLYSLSGVVYNKIQLAATNKDKSKGGLSAGAIAGIVIACVVVVGVAVFLGVYFGIIRKRKGNDGKSNLSAPLFENF